MSASDEGNAGFMGDQPSDRLSSCQGDNRHVMNGGMGRRVVEGRAGERA